MPWTRTHPRFGSQMHLFLQTRWRGPLNQTTLSWRHTSPGHQFFPKTRWRSSLNQTTFSWGHTFSPSHPFFPETRWRSPLNPTTLSWGHTPPSHPFFPQTRWRSLLNQTALSWGHTFSPSYPLCLLDHPLRVSLGQECRCQTYWVSRMIQSSCRSCKKRDKSYTVREGLCCVIDLWAWVLYRIWFHKRATSPLIVMSGLGWTYSTTQKIIQCNTWTLSPIWSVEVPLKSIPRHWWEMQQSKIVNHMSNKPCLSLNEKFLDSLALLPSVMLLFLSFLRRSSCILLQQCHLLKACLLLPMKNQSCLPFVKHRKAYLF